MIRDYIKKIKVSKKMLFIILCVLFVFIVALFICFYKDELFKKVYTSNMGESNIEVNEIVVLDSGQILDYEIFFKDAIDLHNVNFSFSNQDENISDKNLIIEDGLVNSVGKYDVKIEIDGNIYRSVLEINDKTAPILEVKDITVNEGEKVDVTSFIVSCVDNSLKECTYDILDLDGNTTNLDLSYGTRKYFIIAKDESENATKKEVQLSVTKKENNSNSQSNVLSTKNVIDTTIENGKYGTKYKVTNTYRITKYQDGTEIKKLIKTSKVLDVSGFNATSKDMEAEARNNTNSNYSVYQEMTNYVNEYRNEVGANPLTLDKELSLLATIRAIEMAYSGKFSHNRPNGLGFYTVGEELGYDRMILGENISHGSGGYNDTTRKAATNWRNSEGHYQNMIKSGFGRIGVGKYTLEGKTYWVQLFCG